MVISSAPFVSAGAGSFASPPALPKITQGTFCFLPFPWSQAGWGGQALALCWGQAGSCPSARDPAVDVVASVGQGCSSAPSISWKSSCLVRPNRGVVCWSRAVPPA